MKSQRVAATISSLVILGSFQVAPLASQAKTSSARQPLTLNQQSVNPQIEKSPTLIAAGADIASAVTGALQLAMSTILTPLMQAINSDRKLGVVVQNNLATDLIGPAYYIESGKIVDPPLSIAAGKNIPFTASKRESTTTGAVGVVTFNIKGTSDKLAILYSVPFDYNLYGNQFSAQVISGSLATNKDLYDSLYKTSNAASRETAGKLVKTRGYYVGSIMGNGGEAKQGVEIYPGDSVIDPSLRVDTYYTLTVKTGDRLYAGTDSNLDIRVVGEKGEFTRRINSECSGNCFERNSTDTIRFMDKYVGRVTQISIRSDMKYAAAGWYLDWLSLESQSGDNSSPLYKSYNFWIETANAWY